MTTFHSLEVVEVRRETDAAVSIRLRVPPALGTTFSYAPGQFLTVRHTIAGEEVRRCYSICSGLDDGELRIAVKSVAGGALSTWANERLAAGMHLDVMPPEGRFVAPIEPGRAKHYLLVAAGSGITPILSILRTVLVREPNSCLTLVYGNRRSGSVMFAAAIDDLKDRHLERLSVVHVLSREPQESELQSGRIDRGKIVRLAAGAVDMARLDQAFLCGPEAMTREVRAALVELGVAAERVHVELFTTGEAPSRARPSATPMPASAAEPLAEIEAILDGRRHRFPFAADDGGVIDAARRAGIELPYSCKGGMCCTCRAKVVEGAATMTLNYSLEPWEQQAGFVLSCQARPTTPRLVLDYDQT